MIQFGYDLVIGVGSSPGDAGHDEPYLYVWAYPAPEAGRFPPLSGGVGAWTTVGLTGAPLTATRLLDRADQRATAIGFLRGGIAGCRVAPG